ncbi:DUF2024 family protein [Flagellimonas sp. S174]|uniref:DUF2024 family protein n=1 Tax=Flagellimonas sp. S174 TaxID=3410790 RepID=UPI003BF53945
MKVSVWDTYVNRNDGIVMHFDILVPITVTEEETIFRFGKKYLDTKPFSTGELSAKKCRFCHIEHATEEMVTSIENEGFTIIEMENCQ